MLMGFGPGRTAHVVREPSVCEQMNCLPSWCQQAVVSRSGVCQRNSAVRVRKSHSAI